jgi:putative oxidoreductase
MLARTNDTWNSLGLLLLRIGAAGLLLYGHGWPKLMRYQERAATFSDPLGVGSTASFILVLIAEVACSLLVMLGLITRLAVIPIIMFLMVAVFIQHANDPWSKKEFALIFAVPFVALFFTGPGRYSIDAMMRSRSPRRVEVVTVR